MPAFLPELLIGPLLVGASTLACRRWGQQIGGVVSAFPAVVGPVLLITAQDRGDLIAARAANGTLLGLVALSGFVLAYTRVAVHARWTWSLAAGWGCAGLSAAAAGWLARGDGFPAGLVAAIGSLSVAFVAMPRAERGPMTGQLTIPDDLATRMILTAALVASLAGAVAFVGPLIGGMLAALPVLASVLAVFTHRRAGSGAAVALLRGMIAGMAGFVGFCAVIAALAVSLGTAAVFAVAALTALALQLPALRSRHRPDERPATTRQLWAHRVSPGAGS